MLAYGLLYGVDVVLCQGFQSAHGVFGREASVGIHAQLYLLLAVHLAYALDDSPIFGNVEDSKKEFDKVHDAITLNKPEDEDFSKILSPMYGTYLPSMQPADSIPEYKVEESKKNMNLSEMLEKPKKETNKQESLFDKEGE